MRIKMLTCLSGADYCLSPGDEYDFGEGEGQRLLDAGFAEPAADATTTPVVTKAVKPARQTTRKINPGAETR